MVVPLVVATVIFRRVTNRLYDVVRESLAVVNADFQESPVRASARRRPSSTRIRTVDRFHALGWRYFEARLQAQRLIATYFPFVLFLSAIADVIVLGVGAAPDRRRAS